MVTFRRVLLPLMACLALAGCSYDWEAPHPGGPDDSGGSPTPSLPGDDGTPDGDDDPSVSGPSGSPGAYCRALATRFCDDFDGAPLASLWDTVKTRLGASVAVVDAAGAPSGGKVMLATASQGNNPGEATVTRSLDHAGQPLEVTFWLDKQAVSQSKPVDALTLVVSHRDHTTHLVRWTLEPDGSSTWSLYENGALLHSGAAGTVPLGQWTPVALLMDGSGATLTVGGVPLSQPLGAAWDPERSTLTLGLTNLANQGGGWRVGFDNVTLQ